MTKSQRIEHKIGNQRRKSKLLALYYKVKPAERGWIIKPGFIQDGTFTPEKL